MAKVMRLFVLANIRYVIIAVVMKTGKLFHELFQIAPLLPLHLVNITPQCDYQFVSPTVKASERRIAGMQGNGRMRFAKHRNIVIQRR